MSAARRLFCTILLTGIGAMPSLLHGEENRAPEDLYKSHCAACHEGAVPRAPHSVRFQMMGPKVIIAALNGGLMSAQGADLGMEEKRRLAEYLGGAKLPVSSGEPAYLRCASTDFDLDQPPKLAGWGLTLEGSRYISAQTAGIAASDVPKLKVKWAFAFPGATRARSQAMSAGGNIFVGSQDGTVYSLDLGTGCVRWTFAADAEVRNSLSADIWRPGDAGARPRVYFGDTHGNAYALDARAGTLLWKTQVESHPFAIVTGAPRLYGNRLYVPVSSNEWAAAADSTYECCSFRGSVVALDTASGKIIWHSYAIAEEPRHTGEHNSAGTAQRGPSGAPIWNSPTIDVKRNRLYLGTGEAYTSPAAPQTDAVVAFDLKSGKRLWWYQARAHDAWNMACFSIPIGSNCPEENGPDLDIGAPPVLHTLPSGKQVIIAGEKSGDIFALDPDRAGKLLWRVKYGRGGVGGGVHWGMAASAVTLFAPNADTAYTGREQGVAKPGLFALDPADGHIKWFAAAPDVCRAQQKPACDKGFSAPPTAIPGVVFQPSFDGWLRAYDDATGTLLWDFDTAREFDTVSGERAQGGSIDSIGAVVIAGHVIIGSGYLFGGRMPGNLLLVFTKNGL